MKTLRSKLIGDLSAQRGAFFAVWMTIVIGLASYGSTYPAGIAMIDSFDATYETMNYANLNLRVENPVEEAPLLDAVTGIDGVENVQGRLVYDVGLSLGELSRVTLRMISVSEESSAVVNDVLIVAGEPLAAPEDILVLESFANFHGLRPGDTVTLQVGAERVERRIAGLVFAPEYLVAGQSPVNPFPQPNTFGVAYATVPALTDLMDIANGQINDVALTITPDADETAVRAGLQDALTDYDLEYLYTRVQTASGGMIDSNIAGNMAVASFFSAMFLTIGGLVMAVLLARLMEAETRRIGTMRALGLGRGEVLKHYLGFPLIISLSGALVGSIIGYILSYAVAAYFIQNLAGGSLPQWVNTPQWTYILFGALVTVVLAMIAGTIPTWRASGTAPGLALRPVTPKGMGRQAQVSIKGLPLAAQQALRNMLRVPTRTLNTLVGVVLGCTVILAASGTADSTVRAVDVQFNDGILYDLQVYWEEPRPAESRAAQIETIDGITDYQLTLLGPVAAQKDDRLLNTLATTVNVVENYYNFETIAGEDAFSREDAIWIGHNLARVLDAAPGDTLTLDALGQTIETEVAGVVNQSWGSPVLIPAAQMIAWTPLNAEVVNAAQMLVEPGQLAGVRQALGDLDGVIGVEITEQTAEDITNYTRIYVNFSYIFMVFGYLLTLVVVFNTVSINLRERHEEMMIMRSMGARLSEIAATVTWEILSITIIGILLSVPLGWLAMDYLLANYEIDFFGMPGALAPLSYGLAFTGVVLIVLLAEWLSLRGLRHADLGKLSKTLSM